MAPNIAMKIDTEFSKYPQRTYPKGQILVFADEEPGHIFYLTSGRVREYDISYRGEEVVVNVFKPPAFFPMSGPISQTKNRFFFKAEIDTRAHLVPPAAALDFVKNNPDVMWDLLERLYKGIDGLLGRIAHLMAGSAQSRLVHELIIDCRRFGIKTEKTAALRVPVSENDLAAHTGLSRETVSRELHKLKASGLVQVSKPGIIINDLPKLEAMLGDQI